MTTLIRMGIVAIASLAVVASPNSAGLHQLSSGTFMTLGRLPGGEVPEPTKISGSGLRVVGKASADGYTFKAFGWTLPGNNGVSFWNGRRAVAPGGGGTVVKKDQGGLFELAPYVKPGDTAALESDAYAINSRDSEVVGDAKSQAGVWQAVRWTKNGPEALPGPNGEWTGASVANDVSADGSVIVGYGRDASADSSRTYAFRCSRKGQSWHTELMTRTATGEIAEFSMAEGISSDGDTICGEIEFGGSIYPCVWRASAHGGSMTLEVLPGEGGQALAATSNGSTVAGYTYLNGIAAACYWMRRDDAWVGPVPIGTLPGLQGSVAYSISEDGSLIAGAAFDPTTFSGYEGLLWSAGPGGSRLMSAGDLLGNLGVLPAGWSLTGVNDVVRDPAHGEVVLVGDGVDAEGDPQGWYAKIPW